ncbi:MAG: PEP-CTERM sorting domain-containing protein [Pseudomonadota bacterium]
MNALSKRPLVVAAALLGLAGAARADLTLVDPVDFQGTGLGSVNTVLTIQSPGSTTTESGSVAWDGTMDVFSGDAMTGGSQSMTRTFADLGVTSASSLRVVFNALEPGAAESITLTDLTLNVFDSTGDVVFSASTPSSYSFADTASGAGNSGFVFALTPSQAAGLQAVFDTSLRVGLDASASDATGGFETFFVANSATVTPIPEPSTWALLLGGLGCVLTLSNRRQRRDARSLSST